jgi:Transposase, Mutator family
LASSVAAAAVIAPSTTSGLGIPPHRILTIGAGSHALSVSIGENSAANIPETILIRRVICSTNSIESLSARYRRAIKARGHFPSEQAAMKCLYR